VNDILLIIRVQKWARCNPRLIYLYNHPNTPALEACALPYDPLKTPWPVAAWWTGAASWFKKKWLLKSDTVTLEQLARVCIFEQREVTEIWAARGKRTFDVKIRMAPTNSKGYVMAVLSPFRPPRLVPPKVIGETAHQLNLFDMS
jgi:hypothetical protein